MTDVALWCDQDRFPGWPSFSEFKSEIKLAILCYKSERFPVEPEWYSVCKDLIFAQEIRSVFNCAPANIQVEWNHEKYNLDQFRPDFAVHPIDLLPLRFDLLYDRGGS